MKTQMISRCSSLFSLSAFMYLYATPLVANDIAPLRNQHAPEYNPVINLITLSAEMSHNDAAGKDYSYYITATGDHITSQKFYREHYPLEEQYNIGDYTIKIHRGSNLSSSGEVCHQNSVCDPTKFNIERQPIFTITVTSLGKCDFTDYMGNVYETPIWYFDQQTTHTQFTGINGGLGGHINLSQNPAYAEDDLFPSSCSPIDGGYIKRSHAWQEHLPEKMERCGIYQYGSAPNMYDAYYWRNCFALIELDANQN